MFKLSIISLLAITCVLTTAVQAQSLDRQATSADADGSASLSRTVGGVRQVMIFGHWSDVSNDRAPAEAALFEASVADSGSSATALRRAVGGIHQVMAFGYWVDVPNDR
jgi:hypothetical protein